MRDAESVRNLLAPEKVADSYLERCHLVAALARIHLARGFSAGIAPPGAADPPWRWLCYIETAEGQLSWHFPESVRHIFDGLPPYTAPWDGHTTGEKYERIARLR